MKAKSNSKLQMDRRSFIKSAGAATAFTIVPRYVLGGPGYVAPSDTVYIAGIGAGGKGTSDLTSCAESQHAKIAVLCDVDDKMAARSRKNFPDAKYYKDFREMFEKEHTNIDAVTVSTPDHTHAVAAMAAIQLGKHVYVQKPLTHSIGEARALTEAASKYKVVTQMGNQAASGEPVRRMKEIVDAGLIGDVTRVYAWSNRPVWPQGVAAPTGKHDIPDELDWDLWLGPAEKIDYNPAYHPFNWRGWWRFGTGALGDMACHIMDPVFRILPIDYPTEVECSATAAYEGFFRIAHYHESCPASSIIHLKFPRTDGLGEIRLTWMDGGLRPQMPDGIMDEDEVANLDNGVIFEGSKGKMIGNQGIHPLLLPRSLNEQIAGVPLTEERVPEGHYVAWVEACMKGVEESNLASKFEYAGPFTEAVLMGNLAIRSYQYSMQENGGFAYPGRKKLLWDARNMKITNFEPANEFVMRQYRDGWSL
jgi:predicted dehydrogenase